MTDPLITLWTTDTEDSAMPLDATAAISRAHELEDQLAARNRMERLAGGAVVLCFAVAAVVFAASGAWVAALGLALVVVGTLSVLRTLRHQGLAPTADPSAPTAAHLAAHRRQLAHQAALLESVPRWYLAPFLPGLTVFFVGPDLVAWLTGEAEALASLGVGLALWLGCLLTYAGIAWLNRHTARGLRAELAALPAEL